MRRIAFEKWEGLGNDFIVIDDARLTRQETVRLCDRNFGIGADGVLSVGRNPPSMIVWNADGGRPEMCGNGLRCAAAYLAPSGALEVETDAGPRRCEIVPQGSVTTVTIDMGVATFSAPLIHRGRSFLRVSMGNPHAVSFEPEVDVAGVGRAIEAEVAGGTNVEFATQKGGPGAREVDLVVWERGVGLTLACGTGACATVAAGIELGLFAFGETYRVNLPGGPLDITIDRGFNVRMTGPARRVFSGSIDL